MFHVVCKQNAKGQSEKLLYLLKSFFSVYRVTDMKRRRQTKQDFIRFESHSAKDILRDAFTSGSQADGSIAVYFSQKVKPLSFKIPFKLALKYSPMWKIFFFFSACPVYLFFPLFEISNDLLPCCI